MHLILFSAFAIFGFGFGQDEVAYSVNKLETDVITIEEKMDELRNFIMEVTPNGDCDQQYRKGSREDGIYFLPYVGHLVKIYCQFDYQSTNHSWMVIERNSKETCVIQRRINGDLDFYKDWNNYTEGFGDLESEFWFGLRHLNDLTGSKPHVLRVDMEDFDGNTAYAEYRNFQVGNANTNYRLSVSGYSGTAGDSLTMQDSYGFSTYDRDNDVWEQNCCDERGGAWWYKSCSFSNLNAKYYDDGTIHFQGIFWFYWKYSAYSLKFVEMKMRPAT